MNTKKLEEGVAEPAPDASYWRGYTKGQRVAYDDDHENEKQLCRIANFMGGDATKAPESDRTIAGFVIAEVKKLRASMGAEPAPVAQFQIRLREQGRTHDWINCPTEARYVEAMETRIYDGRKLYSEASRAAEPAPLTDAAVEFESRYGVPDKAGDVVKRQVARLRALWLESWSLALAARPAPPVEVAALTDEQIEAGYKAHDWPSVPHPFRGSVGFERGVRFAEASILAARPAAIERDALRARAQTVVQAPPDLTAKDHHNGGLERAAALCERIGDETASFYADAIRALKEKP